jgi:hypothetical protein
MKFWSEVPTARAREVLADVSTWVWVFLWTTALGRLYLFIAGFAEIGRTIRQGGVNLEAAGDRIGTSLSGVPLVGTQARDVAVSAFDTAGQPFVFVGHELEQLILTIAAVLTFILAVITIGPWLWRYVPWRAKRLARVRAAHRAIRVAPKDVSDTAIDRLLASRAIHRLSYSELLSHSPDPLGDFARGRYDRLARAELESVGLRP